MKAIICAGSGQVEIFSFGENWTACPCGNVRAKWLDSRAGTMVADAADRDAVRLLGLNNQLLLPAVTSRGQVWQDYRRWHDIATNAPGFIFDKDKANCWAVVALIGSTSDSRWATDDERAEAWPDGVPR